MYSSIPEELVSYIIDFLFGTCNNCNTLTHRSDLYFDFIEVEYRTIFDDDYYDPPVKVHPVICASCVFVKMYKE